MKIFVPWGAMLIIISLWMLREYNRVRKAKREERQERLNDRRQELLDNLIRARKKKDEASTD